MLYHLIVNGVETKVTINKESLKFESDGTESITYMFDDVIGCEEVMTGWVWKTEVTRVWLIEHGSSNLLLKKCRVVSGDQRRRFQHDLTEKIVMETKRPKKVLVMINPNGGNRTATRDLRDIVEPVFRLSGMSMDIILSEYPGHLIAATKGYDFTNIDGIVLLGGDGTYHEVLNVLMRKRQEEQGVDINDPNAALSPLNIPLGLIPTGTKSHWSELHIGSLDVLTATLHIVQGKTVPSNVMVLYSNGKLVAFVCAGFSHGYLSNLVSRCDRNFRWLGRSRYRLVSMWMLLFESLTQYVYDAKVTFYTSVTKRQNTETNEKEIFVADRKLTGYSSYTSDTVTYNRTFWDLMNFNGNANFDGSIHLDGSRMFVPKPTMFSSFVLFGTIQLESVRKAFKQLREKTCLDQFPNELDVLPVRGLKLELTGNPDDAEPDTSMGRRKMVLDGEMYDLETPTSELWYKEDVVPIFSSYL
ncbi:ceramide kinase-like [Ostrea edulis]|uniref:ceramide kinase-like n=1 Tax=Ostrea edulis TaxID=37623 RepID=UPI0024AF3328|nr:ceramide kinase-like [Ostrea edulis]